MTQPRCREFVYDTYRISTVHDTNNLYQECTKSDQKVLKYGSGRQWGGRTSKLIDASSPSTSKSRYK